MSGQERIPPHNINTISSGQLINFIGVKKNINYGIMTWSKSKFCRVTSEELSGK